MKTLIPILAVVSGLSILAFSPAIMAQSPSGESIIVSVEEWEVPFDETRSRDPYVSPVNGKVYFAGQRADYIGHFDPDTGEFGYFDLDEGAGPHTVVVADDGTLWYAGNRDRHIGKMDPDTGEITRYEMDSDYARDPHTFDFDKDGNIWFTAQGGNGVGHFNTTTGETVVIPAITPNSRPYGIKMDRDDHRPWIALVGTNGLATVNPETMEFEEIELPREETRVRRLDVTSDGNVWYADFSAGYIGRYNPTDGSITEWETPNHENARIYAALVDDKDRMWFSDSGTNPVKLYAFDTQSEEFVAEQTIESANGSIRHMMYDVKTRSMWFGTDTGHIGRLVLN